MNSQDPAARVASATIVHARRADGARDHAPEHTHPEAMLFLPVQGSVTFWAGRPRVELRCDEHLALCVQADAPHAHQARSAQVEYLVVFLPAPTLAQALARAKVQAPPCGAWTLAQSALMREAAAQLCAEASARDASSEAVATACVQLLAQQAARGLLATQPLLDPWRPLPEDARLARALSYARQQFRQNPSVDELARAAAMSRRSFERACRQTLGVTPRQLVESLRLHEARQRLVGSQDSVTQIAFEVGYRDLSHFIRAFQGAFGHSPTMARSGLRLSPSSLTREPEAGPEAGPEAEPDVEPDTQQPEPSG